MTIGTHNNYCVNALKFDIEVASWLSYSFASKSNNIINIIIECKSSLLLMVCEHYHYDRSLV